MLVGEKTAVLISLAAADMSVGELVGVTVESDVNDCTGVITVLFGTELGIMVTLITGWEAC